MGEDAGIEHVPPEILSHIFSFLSRPQVVTSVVPVCKTWMGVSYEKPQLWRALSLYELPVRGDSTPSKRKKRERTRRESRQQLEEAVSSTPALRGDSSDEGPGNQRDHEQTNKEKTTDDTTDRGILGVVRRPYFSRYLQEVALTDDHSRRYAHLARHPLPSTVQSVVHQCRGLRKIELFASSQTAITNELLEEIAEHSPELETLVIYASKELCREPLAITPGVLHVLKRCSQTLRMLVLECVALRDADIEAMVPFMRNLKQLSVLQSKITNVGLTALADNCRQLETLEIPFARRISDAGALRLCDMPALAELDLRNAKLSSSGTAAVLSKLHNLHYLNLNHCTGVKDVALRSLARNSLGSNLRVLLLACCKITNEGLELISQHCSQLVAVNLEVNKCLTDKGLCALFTNNHSLQRVYFGDDEETTCEGITDVTLRALADNCPRLQLLSVTNCKITDRGVAAMVRGCRQLATLLLEFNRSLTDRSFTNVARHCAELNALEINECLVTDKGLQAVVQQCRKLTEFDIWSCQQVTDRTVELLLEHCDRRRMKTIVVNYCRTTVGSAALRAAFPGCVVQVCSNDPLV
jgi:hypothetical protein